jgi:hypothetical protein
MASFRAFLYKHQALRQVVFGQCPASVRSEFFAQGILPTTMFSRFRVFVLSPREIKHESFSPSMFLRLVRTWTSLPRTRPPASLWSFYHESFDASHDACYSHDHSSANLTDASLRFVYSQTTQNLVNLPSFHSLFRNIYLKHELCGIRFKIDYT